MGAITKLETQNISFGVQQWQALYEALGEQNLGWGCDEPVTLNLKEGTYQCSCDQADGLYDTLKGLDKQDGDKDGQILLRQALKHYKPKGFSGTYLKDGRVVPITAEALSVRYDPKFTGLLDYLSTEKIEVKINEQAPQVVDSSQRGFLKAIALQAFDNGWDRESLESLRQHFREIGTLYFSVRVREHSLGLATSCVPIYPHDDIPERLGIPDTQRYYYTLDLSQPRGSFFESEPEKYSNLNGEELLLHGALYDHLANQYGPAQTNSIFLAQLQRYVLEHNPGWDASEIEIFEKLFASKGPTLRILETLVTSCHSQTRKNSYREIYSTGWFQPHLNILRDLEDEKFEKISAKKVDLIFSMASITVTAIQLGFSEEAKEFDRVFSKLAEPEATQDYEGYKGILTKIWGTLERDPNFHNPLKG